MTQILFFIAISVGLSIARAESTLEGAYREASETASRVNESLQESLERRTVGRWGGSLNYSLFETWIPSKYGATLFFPASKEKDLSWEFEYLRGSLSIPFFVRDIGSMTEEKYSLLRRSFAGRNSFHFISGFTIHEFRAHLGDEYLESIAGPSSRFDIVHLRTLGLTLGVGNRWHLPRQWVFTVDWFQFSLPFIPLISKAPFLDSSADSRRKNEVDRALGVIEKLPSLTLGKISIGYQF